MENVEYDYHKNEWVALYNDANGKMQVKYFDLYKDAIEALNGCCYKIGVVTAAYYQKVICK